MENQKIKIFVVKNYEKFFLFYFPIFKKLFLEQLRIIFTMGENKLEKNNESLVAHGYAST